MFHIKTFVRHQPPPKPILYFMNLPSLQDRKPVWNGLHQIMTTVDAMWRLLKTHPPQSRSMGISNFKPSFCLRQSWSSQNMQHIKSSMIYLPILLSSVQLSRRYDLFSYHGGTKLVSNKKLEQSNNMQHINSSYHDTMAVIIKQV